MSMIDTPEGIEVAGLLALSHALALEINTGMKMSRGFKAIDAAVARGYTGKRTGTVANKKAALEWTVAEIQKRWAGYTVSPSVARALEA